MVYDRIFTVTATDGFGEVKRYFFVDFIGYVVGDTTLSIIASTEYTKVFDLKDVKYYGWGSPFNFVKANGSGLPR